MKMMPLMKMMKMMTFMTFMTMMIVMNDIDLEIELLRLIDFDNFC